MVRVTLRHSSVAEASGRWLSGARAGHGRRAGPGWYSWVVATPARSCRMRYRCSSMQETVGRGKRTVSVVRLLEGLLETGTAVLAVWGAALSTLLGVVQLSDRRVKLHVGWDFRPIRQGGNTIEINNLSNRAVLVRHWELFALTGRVRRKRRNIESAIDLTGSFRIEAHDRRELKFDEGDHFVVRDHERLYLRMYIAGTVRRSICRRIGT